MRALILCAALLSPLAALADEQADCIASCDEISKVCTDTCAKKGKGGAAACKPQCQKGADACKKDCKEQPK